MTTPVIAIIGAGNMGRCLIGGLLHHGHPADKLWATLANKEKQAALTEQFNIHVTTNNIEAAQHADIVIFAVKPHLFEGIATHLKNTLEARKPLVLSIAAGVRIPTIQAWLGEEIAIVRAMPNTPAFIGCGASALYANPRTTQNERNMAESILRAMGLAVWVPNEASLDTVTALSGSGPAYFFLFMEALQEAGEKNGLPANITRLLTLQTALGAARMAIESDMSLAELRHSVTSPFGTTEKAVSVFEQNHLRDIVNKAIMAAKQRAEEIAEGVVNQQGPPEVK